MEKQILIIWIIGATSLMVCDALTIEDSGRSLRYIPKRLDSEQFHLVNVTKHSVRNYRLLTLIKNVELRQHLNVNKRRRAPIISQWQAVPDGINNQRIRKRRAYRPKRERRHLQPVFDADKFIKRLWGNKLTICKRVICDIGTYVKHCISNFTTDVCTPCPPGTTLLDVTKSEEDVLECQPIHHCHQFAGTVRTTEVYYCAGDVRLQCRCDTEWGKCGLDPCNCQKQKCRHDEVLCQNCTCESRATTTARAVVSTTGVLHSTPAPTLQHNTSSESPHQMKTKSSPDRISPQVQTDKTLSTATTSTTQNSNSGDKVSWKTVGASIGICFVILIIYHYRQQIFGDMSAKLSSRLGFHRVPSSG